MNAVELSMEALEIEHTAGSDSEEDAAGGAITTGMSQSDLAELMRSFNAVTERLQHTHVALQNEVRRLKRELRDTNEQLRRSRELAALGQMAAGIAHEIRNPLGSIRLYASMLAQDLADRPDSERMARKIEQATADLDAIVGDVLAFSREIRPRISPVSLRALASNALDSCISLIHAGEVRIIRRDAESGLGDEVLADPAIITQAIGNVIRNAIEAMGGRGEITIDIQPIQLSADEDDEEDDSEVEGIGLVISDTGPGFEDDAMSRAFNPFFTTRNTGTGLGLAITHRFIDAHQGRITIGNAESGGARVLIALPRAREEFDGHDT